MIKRPGFLSLQWITLAVMVVTSPVVSAADLSMLSDFGRLDIPQQKLGAALVGNSMVGVMQEGDLNVVSVQQSGGTGNNTQVWQSGIDLQVAVQQRGADNELRLSQMDAQNRGGISQDGFGNQAAIQQFGIDNDVTGNQVGDANQLVLLQHGADQFSFTQQGNQNQILADMPAGVSVHVDQIGNNLSFQLMPN
jgi:minor curlin subunit